MWLSRCWNGGPQDVHVPLPGACDRVTCHGTWDFADVTHRRELLLDDLGGPGGITRSFLSGRGMPERENLGAGILRETPTEAGFEEGRGRHGAPAEEQRGAAEGFSPEPPEAVQSY